MASDFSVMTQRWLQLALARLSLDWGVDSTRPWSELALRSGLSALQLGAGQLLRVGGLRRELRRRGELRFALWRVPLSFEHFSRSKAPSRFLRGAGRSFSERDASPRSPLAIPRGRVLWIPGWGDTPFSWFPLAVASTLQQGFEELVILDFPGFHGSLAHSRCITHLDRFFELTQDLVREFRPDALVGHSLGGWLAARAACDPLTAPSRLILMAPSGLCGGAAERAQWQKEFQSVVRSASAEEYGKKLFAKPPAGWGKVGSVFLPFLEREDTREFLDSVEARHFLDESTEALLSQMSVKQVHLLWGVSDQVVPERFSAHWLKHVPQAQLTRWQNVGHMPHVEKPLALLRWLRRNLSDLS